MNKRLAHIVFQTNQVREMRDFYMTLLEAHAVFENEAMCFITYDDEHHRVAFMNVPGGSAPKPPNSVGLMHSAFTFVDLESLLKNHQRLMALGIEPIAPIQHGPTTSIYYRNPDRCLVELQIDNFQSAAEATAFMQSTEYSEDPLGPLFDPVRMREAFARGVPQAELLTRGWGWADPQEPNALECLTS